MRKDAGPGKPKGTARPPREPRRERREGDPAPREAEHTPRAADRTPRAADRAPREADRTPHETDRASHDDGLEARAARREMSLPPPHARLRNIRLLIEYDGSRFAGWQVQPKARTVAGVVEKALAEILGDEVRLVGAGRTDEGVHAEGQVANFLTKWKHPAAELVHALEDRLPDDVVVLEAKDVGPEFHARHSATSRVYRYHVIRRHSAFVRRRAWHVKKAIEVTRMRESAALLAGMHDFAGFADLRLHGGRSTKVLVDHAGWRDSGPQLVFRIAASHFLPRMVRRLVGCLVRVGTGDLAPATFREWLETGKGESGPLTAPSMGLFLEHVEYPADVLRAPTSQPWRAREGARQDRRGRTSPVARRAVEALEKGDEDDEQAPRRWQVDADA